MSKMDDPRMGFLFQNHQKGIQPFKVALIGYANDEGVSRNKGRKGASGGPDVVRTMLKKKGCIINEEYNVSLEGIEIKDFGNSSGSKDLKSVHKSHKELVLNVLREGYLPIIIGGGNDQSYPNFLGLLEHLKDTNMSMKEQDLLVVNIDAHLDVRPLLDGEEPHSGSPFRQILETDTEMNIRFVEFGCQGSQCSSVHSQYVEEKGGRIVWLKDLHGSLLEGAPSPKCASHIFNEVLSMDCCGNVFVSFDIDSIRASDCPGVSCPSPIGLTSEEALSICYKAGLCPHVKMIDFSEFNPEIESYITATLVSNMIYYFLMGVSDRIKPHLSTQSHHC